MCFFGKPSIPEPVPAPTPEPPPTVASPPPAVPTHMMAGESAASAEARRKKAIKATRYGILSTIKTSPLGIVGAGTEQGKKSTLGS